VADSVSNLKSISQPIVSAEAVGRYYYSHSAPGATVKAVDGVSVEIQRGQTFCLVGESGCGKSSLAKLFVGLEEPSFGTMRFKGEVYNSSILRKDIAARSKIQMIFQDPFASLNPRHTVSKIIQEPIRFQRRVSAREADRLSRDYLKQVGLSDADLDRFPHQFSGGQRQRISIARALASNPELLICDEPTSALDVSVQAQVLNLLKDLQAERDLTYLFITHNLSVVYHLADTVAVMYLGKLVEVAPKRTFFEWPKHPYSRLLLDTVPKLHRAEKRRASIAGELPNPLSIPDGCSFHARCPLAFSRCKVARPELKLMEDGAHVACHAIEEQRGK